MLHMPCCWPPGVAEAPAEQLSYRHTLPTGRPLNARGSGKQGLSEAGSKCGCGTDCFSEAAVDHTAAWLRCATDGRRIWRVAQMEDSYASLALSERLHEEPLAKEVRMRVGSDHTSHCKTAQQAVHGAGWASSPACRSGAPLRQGRSAPSADHTLNKQDGSVLTMSLAPGRLMTCTASALRTVAQARMCAAQQQVSAAVARQARSWQSVRGPLCIPRSSTSVRSVSDGQSAVHASRRGATLATSLASRATCPARMLRPELTPAPAPAGRQVVAVLPSNPVEQLRLAHAITCHAYSGRVTALEAEVGRMRRSAADKAAHVRTLETRLTSLQLELQDALDKARRLPRRWLRPGAQLLRPELPRKRLRRSAV